MSPGPKSNENDVSCPISTPSSEMKVIKGYWGTIQETRKREPEIVTVTPSVGVKEDDIVTLGSQQDTKKSSEPSNKAAGNKIGKSLVSERIQKSLVSDSFSYLIERQTTAWSDLKLRELMGKNGVWKKIAWLPGGGRHIDEGHLPYKLFTQIYRTLHLEDAIEVLSTNRLMPKNIITFSSIQSSFLPKDHPIKNLKVLWFGAKHLNGNDDQHDWYGNVEFAVDCNLLLDMFRYSFLVEVVTTPTHTMSRILLTNSDYSDVLHVYDKEQSGGGWKVQPEGQSTLCNCSRYEFRGFNINGHVLEFLLEVTPKMEKRILSHCKISFKNHDDAEDISIPHVCNKFQKLQKPCPSPFSSTETAQAFRQQLVEKGVDWKKVLMKLTDHAKQHL